MRKKLFTLIACLAVSLCSMAQFDNPPAFPGAEGFGRFATGGRPEINGTGAESCTVYHVTSLEDYCSDADYDPDYKVASPIKGTLRYAVESSGRRFVVFDVAGTIALKCPLKIAYPNITILGQTAPGDGICLKNYTFSINASNVIVRYIRCRMGDEGIRYYKNKAKLSGSDMNIEDDAMNSYHGSGDFSNIIIDHCSMSWSVDECGSFYGNNLFTLQWSIISESLRNSKHDKGAHGYGGIWGGQSASFHHNLIADHDSRNPRFDHDYVSTLKGPVDYVNNVLYNWGGNSSYGGESSNSTAKLINMVNNYYKPGPASQHKTRLLNPTTSCSNCTDKSKTSSSIGSITPGMMYINGNYMYGSDEVTNDNLCDAAIDPDASMSYADWKSSCVASARAVDDNFDYNVISLHSAQNAYEKVRRYAGVSLSRDNIDKRIAYDLKNGSFEYSGSNGSTNGLIDTQGDVGGWPELIGTTRTIGTTGSDDSDSDGIPDAWETAHDLTVGTNNAITFSLDSKNKYYTDLEVYANYLVQDITQYERQNADATFTEYYPLGENTLDPEKEPADPVLPVVPTIETISASNKTESSNADIVVTSCTLGGAANPTGTADNYLKLRTSADWTFTVNSGYKITAIKVVCYQHGNNASTSVMKATSVTTDGGSNLLTSDFSIPASGSTGTLELKDLSATKNIVFKFDTSGIVAVDGKTAQKQVYAIITITYEKTATGIEEVTSTQHPISNTQHYYNLSGQRVSPGTKGILIHNGKKIIRN